ncbi:cytochrome P450 CYP304F2 [Danaus plexippus plexippus]|uniref:Cytochrome P450 CYP304F2 n=1 Tax=Danaus plexippus plexippus TaxID=278856 RepID=A0A212ESI9_DANPL|nr:cytochrome P450 CYP304F2 [Danaus plexippus plexippus]
MIGLLILVFFIIFYCVRCFKNAYKRPSDKFPPGPPKLPIHGAYWIVVLKKINNLAASFKMLSKEYKTKVLGLYLGNFVTIIVDDPHLIKECLNREEFDGRVDFLVARLRSFWKKLGIFFTDGYFWHVQRRFSLRYMRDFGFGRREETLETCFSNDIKEMINMATYGPNYPAEKAIIKGDLICLQDYFAVPFINGMLHVLVRNPLPRSEYKVLWELSRYALKFQRGTNDLGGAVSLTPCLKDLMPKLSGYHDLRSGNQYLLDFFNKIIKDQMSTYDTTHLRHFIDVYVKKMKEEEKDTKRSTFSVEQLQLICTDYMFPAASAVQAVLTFLVERLLIQPEVQDRIHEEIDRVVGRDRMPSLDDRQNMPYTEACIREIMRFETLVPLGVLHRTVKPTTIDEYHIPENTVVAFNYVSLHMDKKLWGDPENFRPERFIKNGILNLSADKSLPFGSGKRLCAGETYARQSMFLVFSAFMQAFHVSTVTGKPLKKPASRIQGIITTIKDFWVKITPRS